MNPKIYRLEHPLRRPLVDFDLLVIFNTQKSLHAASSYDCLCLDVRNGKVVTKQLDMYSLFNLIDAETDILISNSELKSLLRRFP